MAEDFEIIIGERAEAALPLRQPDFSTGQYAVWGKPAVNATRVIFSQTAYRQVKVHTESDTSREVGGVLLGHAFVDTGEQPQATYVEITASIKAQETHAGPTHLTFTPDAWAAINRERERDFPALQIVGWYHSHPHMDVFVSGDDQFLHRHFFAEAWHIALVVEPVKDYGGFFATLDGKLRLLQGFYEHFDVQEGSEISWKNVPEPVILPVQATHEPEVVQRQQWNWAVGAVVALVILLLAAVGALSITNRQLLDTLQATQLAALHTANVQATEQADLLGREAAATESALALRAEQTTEAQATLSAHLSATPTITPSPSLTATWTTSPVATATDMPTPLTPVAQVLHAILLSTGPGSAYPTQAGIPIPAGSVLGVLGISPDAAWYLVEPPVGETGWIPAGFVTVIGNMGAIPLLTPSSTPVPTATMTPSLTPTPTATATATSTPTATPTMTATPTATATPTMTATPTTTVTPSLTPTATATATPMITVAPTMTMTASPTSTATVTATSTPTIMSILTVMPSLTSTATSTVTEVSVAGPEIVLRWGSASETFD